MTSPLRFTVGSLALALMTASTASIAADPAAIDLSRLGVAAPVAPFGRVQPTIVGGQPATGDRSYQVHLNQGCGGTIIADQWVLTAAHCGAPRTIRAGVRDLSKNEGQTFTVAQYVRHPNYNQPKDSSNDFALVKINGTFDPSYVRAQLPNDEVTNAVGQPNDLVVVSGWGALTEGGGSPNILQQVTIPIVSDAVCSAPAAYGNGLDANTMLCAGLAGGGKDSCQGDSGGPLVATYQNRIYSLGVVSFGDGCARPNKYGVYSETLSAVNWIRTTIGDTTTPPPPPPPGNGSQTYSNGTDVQIRDNATVESAISVSGRSGNADPISVAVDIRHTYIGDLLVQLIAPDGSAYTLSNRAGGGTDNIIKTYTGSLSSETKNGTWKLRVNDNASQDTGIIDSWSVTF